MKMRGVGLILLLFLFVSGAVAAGAPSGGAGSYSLLEMVRLRPEPKNKLQGLCWRLRWGLNKTFTGRSCIKVRKREKDGKLYFLYFCGRETQD